MPCYEMRVARVLQEKIRTSMASGIDPSIINETDLKDLEPKLMKKVSELLKKPIRTHKDLNQGLEQLWVENPTIFKELLDWLLEIFLRIKGLERRKKKRKKERTVLYS
jgi:hypothetical protein